MVEPCSFQSPSLCMSNRLAKLCCAQLVEVGVPFSYQRMPGPPGSSAQLTVSPSRADVLNTVYRLMAQRTQRENSLNLPD